MDLTHEEILELSKLASLLTMFGGILIILRWFKTDTADLIKIYAESTKAQIDSFKADTRIQIEAIKEDVKAIQGDVLAIKEDVKGFQEKMYEIQFGLRKKDDLQKGKK